MRDEVMKDLSDSARAFKDIVWPEISKWCGGGDLVPVEGVTDNRMTRNLDMMAGIDAWQVCHHLNGIRGIASRIQFGEKPWASFTIRASRTTGATTELAKRLAAIADKKRGWLLPALTVQAYVSSRWDGRLLYACMVDTVALFEHIRDGSSGIDYTENSNPSDGNTFIVAWVEWLNDSGVRVREYCAAGESPVRPRRRGELNIGSTVAA